ncbi:MAG: helix-turn-helix domain-containing protein [Clostridiales bacterium]|nr:helix-turn-helix domain-containing protein [Clostridiales bacterium]
MANPRQTPAHAMALLDQAVAAYGPGESRHPSLQAIGEPLGLNPLQVRKLLITAGVYKSAKAERVLALYREGKTVEEIVERTGLSRVSVYTYLPYTRGVRPEEPEEDPADRAEREREAAVCRLAAEPTAENLWAALLLFQSCPFHTAKGLEFSYTIKGGELFVSRKEKSITRSSVEMAFRRALALGEVSGPKKLGVFGASHLYPVFLRLGVITAGKKN